MAFDKKMLSDTNKSKLQRLDQKALRLADALIDNDIARGKDLEILQSIKDQYAEKRFLTEKQRELIRKINRGYDDYDYHHTLCTRLVELMEEGKTANTAETFIRSVVEFFNEKHSVTPLQLEQMIRIVQEAEGEKVGDVKDDEDDGM